MGYFHRRRRWILVGTITSTLGVILWGVYAFSVIWLRRSYARELTAHARTISELRIPDDPSAAVGSIYVDLGARMQPDLDYILERVEALQQPRPGNVMHYLFERIGNRSREEAVVYSTGEWLALPAKTPITQSPGGEEKDAVLEAGGAATATAAHTLLLWELTSGVSGGAIVYEVTDTNGEPVLLVSRAVPADSTGDAAARHEILLVDAAGQILERIESRAGTVLGRLPQRLGKADQLVFGSRIEYAVDAEGVFHPRPGAPVTIYVVENGALRAVERRANPRLTAPAAAPDITPEVKP